VAALTPRAAAGDGGAPRIRARLASQNANKLAELRAALPGWHIESLSADGWPEETGATYEENALLKARFGRTLAGADEWVLGEDSGIECDALGGEPGLRSARWAPGRDQADALLERLGDEPNRGARMVAALVAVAPDGTDRRGEGVLEGAIALERRGTGGFGYDPVFVPDGEERTVAELGDAWKVAHSHRGRAAAALDAAVGNV
jgi:XTP/dITP diphosphohydrolase